MSIGAINGLNYTLESRLIRSVGCACSIILLLLFSHASFADFELGVDWLSDKVQADGSIATDADIATPLQSTAETLRAISQLSVVSFPNVEEAQAFIANETYLNSENLSRQIIALSEAGQSTAEDVPLLLLNRQMNGGFSELPGYSDTRLDTAFALDALTNAGEQSSQAAGFAVNYLLTQQRADGGWSDGSNESNIYTTALVAQALLDYRSVFLGVPETVDSAQEYLIAQRDSGSNLWPETFESALALQILIANSEDSSVYQSSVTALAEAQLGNGSWDNDVYQTALALRTLHLADNPPVLPTRVRIEGRVVDALSEIPIEGAELTLSGDGNAMTLSGSDGRFSFNDLPAGSYSVQATATDYGAITASLTVGPGTVADVGDLPLVQGASPTSGIIRGTVTNSTNDFGLPGVQITALEDDTIVASTDGGGSFQIVNVPPDVYTLRANLAGFTTAGGVGEVTAGNILVFSPSLGELGTVETTISGIVTDIGTGLALEGVNVELTGSTIASTTTNADGQYTISDLSSGGLQVSARLSGYYTASGSTEVVPGASIDFSPGLTPDTGVAPGSKIVGTITDASTGLPLEAVLISLSGANSASASTDVNGEFEILDVNPGITTVTATLPGYFPEAGTVDIQPSTTLVFSPPLIPQNSNVPTDVFGVVIDAGTNLPLEGVSIEVMDANLTQIINSASDGTFEVLELVGAASHFSFQIDGYVSANLAVPMSASTSIDLGQIRLREVEVIELIPDLVITQLVNTQTSTDPDSLSLTGNVDVKVTNEGTSASPEGITITAYYDADRDSTFSSSDDVLGSQLINQDILPAQTLDLLINVSGQLPFRDAPISVFVDSEQQLVEISEENNISDSSHFCEECTQDFPTGDITFEAVEKWRRNVSTLTVPIAGPLIDTNEDGIVNEQDEVIVIYTIAPGFIDTASGPIEAVRGIDGQLMWTSDDILFRSSFNPTIGDIDADGFPEVISASPDGGLIVLNGQDGSLKWSNDLPGDDGANFYGNVYLADLEGDGSPEVVTRNSVFDGSGNLLFQYGTDIGSNNAVKPIVFDYDLDGLQEIYVNGHIYDHKGQLVFESEELGNALAIGNFDDDPLPEFVQRFTTGLSLIDTDGTEIWRVTFPDSGGGVPLIADFDGDGEPEIGVAAVNNYWALDTDGSFLWDSPTPMTDHNGRMGSSAFDFDGDGAFEILLADQNDFRIISGATGEVLFIDTEHSSPTLFEYPVVADIDGDSRAEVLVVSTTPSVGLRAFEEKNDNWYPARNVWNQYDFTITNINSDNSIPTNPIPSWLDHNSFRATNSGQCSVDPPSCSNLGPIRNIEDIESITIWEVTSQVMENTFLVSMDDEFSEQLPGPLSGSNNDFMGAEFDEYYDVFYSDADGTFNPDGEYISVEAIWTGPGAGLNVSGIELGLSNGERILLNQVTSYVGLGDTFLADRILNAVDGDFETFTRMGNTIGTSQRMRVTLGFNCAIDEDLLFIGTFPVSLKWHWESPTNFPEDDNVVGMPVVVQLNDDNNDGSISELDMPDLVFPSYQLGFGNDGVVVRAVNGSDGSEIWSAPNSDIINAVTPAAADLNGDGMVEIVMAYQTKGLIALDSNGSVVWTLEDSDSILPEADLNRGAPNIADIDFDGIPEIVYGNAVVNSDGTVRWVGSQNIFGSWNERYRLGFAADIRPEIDGLEVVVGPSMYDKDGNLLWVATSVPDGYAAVGDLNLDGLPEIVVVGNERVYALDQFGKIIWGPVVLPATGDTCLGGPPTLADTDGDGFLEIGIAGRSSYFMLNHDGSSLWSSRVQDFTSCQTGSTVFDFQGDGRAEVIYADELAMRIYDGSTGQILTEIPNDSGTGIELPVVADIDQDGQAELIVVTNESGPLVRDIKGVRVFESAGEPWIGTRSIWNQHAYHISHVNDDGTVPNSYTPSWETHNTFRLNTFEQGNESGFPDLTASLLTVADNSASLTVSARVGNSGPAVSPAGLVARFYDGDPSSGIELGSVSLGVIESSTFEDIALSVSGPLQSDQIHLFVEAEEQIEECDETNNLTSINIDAAIPTGSIGVSTDSLQYGPNGNAVLSALVANSGQLTSDYVAELSIRDEFGGTVTSFDESTVINLSANDSENLIESWNTGVTLAGNYVLYGELFSASGQLIDEDNAPFQIVNDVTGEPTASIRTTTDRPTYHTFDFVSIQNLIQNITVNTLLTATQLQLVVTDPSSSTILESTIGLADIVPGGLDNQFSGLTLDGAEQGGYLVVGTLLSSDDAILASDLATFTVVENLSISLQGEVEVATPSIMAGESQSCSYTITNTGTAEVSNQPLRRLILDIVNENQLAVEEGTSSLIAGGSEIVVDSVATDGLFSGAYACALQALINDEWISLASDTFSVVGDSEINLDATLSVGDRGRLLILLDEFVQPTQVCRGLGSISFDHKFDAPLHPRADIVARLRNQSTSVIETEKVSLDDFVAPWDQNSGTSAGNLLIADLTDNRLNIVIEAQESRPILSSQLFLDVTIKQPGQHTIRLKTGLLDLTCDTDMVVGEPKGDFTVDVLEFVYSSQPGIIGDGDPLFPDPGDVDYPDPFGPIGAPGLKEQWLALTRTLDSVGWSYAIVYSGKEFAKELRTNGYLVYAIFSENKQLRADMQKELQVQLSDGDGLVVAGGYRNPLNQLEDALGITTLGQHEDATGVEFGNTPLIPPQTLEFENQDKDIKFESGSAAVAGEYQLATPTNLNTAMTYHQYGEGVAVFAGFDLIMNLTEAGIGSPYAELLLNSLDYVHPENIDLTVGSVIPITLTVTNQGIATPGVATITLPSGSEILDSGNSTPVGVNEFEWTFELDSNQQATYQIWARFPTSPAILEANIQTGISPDLVDAATISLELELGVSVKRN